MRLPTDIDFGDEVAALLDALARAGHAVALVGGAVRDTLLDRRVHDLDVVTSASPSDVTAVCAESLWCRRVFEVGERYGTVGVVLTDGQVVEVSQLRAGPTGGDLSACGDFGQAYARDAEHRDFTVNALALSWPALELLDPTGGIADLEAGVLRAFGDPGERFAEDPLRVVRAARFAAELEFRLEPKTLAALAEVAPRLSDVAVERVRDELTATLTAVDPQASLRILRESGALAIVLPEVAALDGLGQPSFHDRDALSHTFQAVAAIPPSPVLRWAALLHDVGKAPTRTVESDGRIRFFRHGHEGAKLAEELCRRLRFSNADRVAIVHLVREHMRWGEVPVDNERSVDKAVRRLDLWAEGANPPRRLVSAEDALELEMADFAATAHRAEAPERRQALEVALAASRERGTRRPPATPVTGRELIGELGIEEGPAVGTALRAVSEAVAAGRIGERDRKGALRVACEALRQRGVVTGVRRGG